MNESTNTDAGLGDGYDNLTYLVRLRYPEGGSCLTGCPADRVASYVAEQVERHPGCAISFEPSARTAAVYRVRKLEERLAQTVESYDKQIADARAAIAEAALSEDEAGLEMVE